MRKLFFILAVLFTLSCEAQIAKTFPSPKIEVVDTMTNGEWVDFFNSQPFIYVKLKNKKDLFPHEYKKTWKYCYLSWYRAEIMENESIVVKRYTHRIRRDEIVRP